MTLEDILRQRLRKLGEEIGDAKLIIDEKYEEVDTLALADHLVEAKIIRKAIRGIFENEYDAKRTIVALQHFNYYELTKIDAVAMVLNCLMWNAQTFADAANAAQALDAKEVHGLLKKYHFKEMDFETEKVYNNVVMSLCGVAASTQDKDTVARVATLLGTYTPNEIDSVTGCFVKVSTYLRDADIINRLCDVFEKEFNEDRESLIGTMNYFDRFIYKHQNNPDSIKRELEQELEN